VATGQLGVAVTTSDIAVGARVPHAVAGLGVAVTQSRTDPRLGPQILSELQGGASVHDAIMRTADAHEHRGWRQLGVLDASGRAADFTGERAWPVAGALAGRDCLAIGNMLAGDSVLPAIAGGFAAAHGHLAGRLIAGLQAGQLAGGEGGALRSAALLLVERESFPLVDLRIDDSGDPLGDLDALWRAYEPWARTFVVRALDPDNADSVGDAVHRSSSTTT
jgi:uncharacterized Ntn-hydrolase superfamily protein